MINTNNIVASYDYYTLSQAKKILRKKKIEEIKFMFGLSLMTIAPILLMIIWYLVFGY